MIDNRVIVFAIGVVLTGVIYVETVAAEGPSLAAQFVAAAEAQDETKASIAIHALRDHPADLTSDEALEILRVALSADLSPYAAAGAMRIAAEHPDLEVHMQMIRELANRLPLLRSPRNAEGVHPMPPKEQVRAARLQSAALPHLVRPEWCPDCGSLPEYWMVIEDSLAFSGGSIDSESNRSFATKSLLQLDGFEDEKEAAVLRMIDLQWDQLSLSSSPLLTMLRPTCWPDIRERLRRSIDDAGPMRLNAASVLAQLGDAEALPLLEELRLRMGESQWATAGKIGYLIGLIEDQNPPERLLPIIEAVTPHAIFETDRRAEWAICRAVQRGLPREAIVRSITARTENLRTAFGPNPTPHQEKQIRWALAWTKRIGLNQGVLTEEDLPEITALSNRTYR